jgi:hypothetical protein
MGSFGVVVADPVGDHDPGFGQGVEAVAVEQLVAHGAVEPFDVAVLLGAALLDVDGNGPRAGLGPLTGVATEATSSSPVCGGAQ